MLPQVIVDPTVNPTLNNGGWVYNAAVLLAAIGVIVTLLIVFGYMRFAPRFQTEEGARTSVRAPRVQPGRDVRRPVNVISAPLVVQPPAVATAVAQPPAASAAQPTATAPAPAPDATPPASAAPSAAPPPPEAVASPPTSEAAPTEGAPAEAPAAQATPAAAPAATAERPEVSLDEETFEKTLAELLAKGTDRRVAEGQARRAAMIAARKKAGG